MTPPLTEYLNVDKVRDTSLTDTMCVYQTWCKEFGERTFWYTRMHKEVPTYQALLMPLADD